MQCPMLYIQLPDPATENTVFEATPRACNRVEVLHGARAYCIVFLGEAWERGYTLRVPSTTGASPDNS
jgi:hypothetical protein